MSSTPGGSAFPLIGQAPTDVRVSLSEPEDIGPFRRRDAPDLNGYIAAAAIALGVGAVLDASVLGGGGDVAGFLSLVGLILAVGFLVVLVVGIPLTAVAHFVLRRVRRVNLHDKWHSFCTLSGRFWRLIWPPCCGSRSDASW